MYHQKFENFPENEWKYNMLKPMGYNESSPEREVWNSKCLQNKPGRWLINN